MGGMRPRVAADGVSFRDDPSQERGITLHLRAQNEERGMSMMSAERVEDPRRHYGIRTVVERQCDELSVNPGRAGADNGGSILLRQRSRLKVSGDRQRSNQRDGSDAAREPGYLPTSVVRGWRLWARNHV